ncbi:hypothetical protein CR513_48679, partial [Mucuna pruriens]
MSLPIEATAKRVLSIETPIGVPWKLPPFKALFLATSIKGFTTEATPDPTAVPFTRATPSLGFNSKNPECRPAKWKASLALRDSPEGPTALLFRLPVSNAAISPNHFLLKSKALLSSPVGGSTKAGGNTINGSAFVNWQLESTPGLAESERSTLACKLWLATAATCDIVSVWPPPTQITAFRYSATIRFTSSKWLPFSESAASPHFRGILQTEMDE